MLEIQEKSQLVLNGTFRLPIHFQRKNRLEQERNSEVPKILKTLLSKHCC